MTSISTICIVGFPPEVHPRELKNLCRYVPGFQGSHVGFVGQTASSLFVKFSTTEQAQQAIEAVHGSPFDVDAPHHTLKAEWARREMEVRPSSLLTGPLAGPGATRPRISVVRPATAGPGMMDGQEVLVTICVLSLREKSATVEELKAYFQAFQGFVSLQVNERIDGMFVRFATRRQAEEALAEANANQLGAEWARRNLDDEGYQPGIQRVPDGVVPLNATQSAGGMCGGGMCGGGMCGGGMGGGGMCGGGMYAGPPSARPDPAIRQVGPGGQVMPEPIMTLCVLSIREKGLDKETITSWFYGRPGFVNLNVNEKIDALFVRFSSVAAAEQALAESNMMQYGAEWARRNLDDDLGLRREAQAVAPQYLNSQSFTYGYGEPAIKRVRPAVSGEELNTICILALRDKGLAVEDVQQWLASRPGFVVLQVNERINAIFAKYATHADAANALNEANGMQFNAEWARRNLGL